MAFNASKSTKFRLTLKKLALIHVHCFCFPKTRFCFFLDEGQGVPGDKVLLHPGDDTLASQNPKFQIMIEKLAYKHVHCPWIYVHNRYINGYFKILVHGQKRPVLVW